MAVDGNDLPQEEQVQEEVLSEDEEAAFNASFGVPDEQSDTQQAEEPAETSSEEQGEADKAEPKDEAVEPTPEEQAEADQAHLKNLLNSLPDLSQKTELTSQEIRKLHGKIGEINKLVHDLKEVRTGMPKITKESFKRLSAEFPEIAEMLAEDMADISGGVAEKAEVPKADVETLVESRVAKVTETIEEKMNIKLLTALHPDWQQVVGTTDFRNWMTTLPANVQQELNESKDAAYISEKLNQFKTRKNNVDAEREKRNERLSRSVLPKTTQRVDKSLMTEEEAFNAAFK